MPVDELDDGAHILTIEFAFPSNSGSLAAAVVGEYYIGTAVYGFTLDKSLAASFGIPTPKMVFTTEPLGCLGSKTD